MAGVFPTLRKNAMLDSLTLSHVSAHTAWHATGGNEVTGGSYARQAITMAAAAGGERAASTAPVISIPASTTVRWLGLFDAVSAGTFQCMVPNGSTKTVGFRAEADTEVFHAENHGFANDSKVTFLGASLPTGITEGNVYFVIGQTEDTFQVSLTQGGAAVDITTDGYGLVFDIIEEVFGGAGTLTVNSYVVGLQGME